MEKKVKHQDDGEIGNLNIPAEGCTISLHDARLPQQEQRSASISLMAHNIVQVRMEVLPGPACSSLRFPLSFTYVCMLPPRHLRDSRSRRDRSPRAARRSHIVTNCQDCSWKSHGRQGTVHVMGETECALCLRHFLCHLCLAPTATIQDYRVRRSPERQRHWQCKYSTGVLWIWRNMSS